MINCQKTSDNKNVSIFNNLVTIWFSVFILSTTIIRAYTPEEIFSDGERAFKLGRWLEAREHFTRFLEKWPNHTLAPKSRYYHILADIRAEEIDNRKRMENRLASLTETLTMLSSSADEKFDTTEIKAVIFQLQESLNPNNASFAMQLDMSPEFMEHAIRRKWFPFKSSPDKILTWLYKWENIHRKKINRKLKAHIELIKAKLLWRFFISPLPTNDFLSTLKMWGEWPIEGALLRSLKSAFTLGDPEVKFEAALLGVSFLSLKRLGQDSWIKSDFYRYLSHRGIHKLEGWCPE